MRWRWPRSRPAAVPHPSRGETRLPIYPEPPEPAQYGIELRPGWRRDDPGLAADVKAFWGRLDLLAPDVAELRVSEIVLGAYAGKRVVGVSTAALEPVDFLRCKMAVYRCAIAPGARGQMMSMVITAHSVKALEAWSLAHPDEGVMGVMAVLENETYRKKTHPHRAPETRLSLVSFNPEGQKIVVAWFDHARI